MLGIYFDYLRKPDAYDLDAEAEEDRAKTARLAARDDARDGDAGGLRDDDGFRRD